MNKAFCVEFFPFTSIDNLDARYECYTKIGLTIVKDREYCELKYSNDND